MTASERCIAAIKRFEGFKGIAYHDLVGRLTIGYGEAVGIKEGQLCTEAEADLMLRAHIVQIEAGLKQYVGVVLTQGQHDACVSFCYNFGVDRFKTSTLAKLINLRKFSEAALEFLKWCNAGGKPEKGLILRRATEKAWFEEAA